METEWVWFFGGCGGDRGVCYVHEPAHTRIQVQMTSCPERNAVPIDVMCGLVWANLNYAISLLRYIR